MKKSLFTFLFLTFSIVFFSVNSSANETLPDSFYQTPPEKLVKVGIKFHINDITEIDEINQTFKVDGYLYASWTDKRLQFDGTNGSKIYGKEQALGILGKDIWWPGLEFMNIAAPRERPNIDLEVFPNGRVKYVERFMATLSASMDLRKFPFDGQNFRLEIESYDYVADNLQFVIEDSPKDHEDDLLNTEWTIKGVNPEVTVHSYDNLGEQYSQYSINIHAERKYGFYLWKIFLPLLLIVGISFVVFWVSDTSIQIGTVQTVLLTVVAFNFIISGMLPKISYITFIDSIINTCYIVICLTLVEVVLYYKITKRGLNFGKDLIRHARWVFPLGLAIAILVQVNIFL